MSVPIPTQSCGTHREGTQETSTELISFEGWFEAHCAFPRPDEEKIEGIEDLSEMMAQINIQREVASTLATPEEENGFNEAVSLDHHPYLETPPIEGRFYDQHDHNLNLESGDRPVPPLQSKAASPPRKDTPLESSLQKNQLTNVETTKIGSSKRKYRRPKKLVRS